MSGRILLPFALFAAFTLAAGCGERSPDPISPPGLGSDALGGVRPATGKVVVANRASGTISVIDAASVTLSATYSLPQDAGEPMPEPMYVVYTQAGRHVWVGDRANDRVAVFNADDFSIAATVPAGRGVFHMWADPQARQLWVNNDIDNTTTVIDPRTLSVVTAVPTPADLVAMGGKPHDVILGPAGEYAYVSVIGLDMPNDYVVQFDTATFEETARAAVGKDVHLSLARQHDRLYVPCQLSDAVYVLDRMTLAPITVLSIPGAHGAGMAADGSVFYTTNISGGGASALYTIETRTNTVVGSPADSPYAVPHNIALTPDGLRLFVTHSGASSNRLTSYALLGSTPAPTFEKEVEVGLNPFGLSYVP